MKLKLLLSIGLSAVFSVGFAQNNATYIDFEDGPYGGGHTAGPENTAINNTYYQSAYGIQFFNVTGSGTASPKYARIGGASAVAFVNSPSAAHPSCGSPSGSLNYDNPYAAGINTGCWFLTDDDGIVTQNPNPLKIVYDQSIQQCTIASGYIYDLDGASNAEAWKLEVFAGGSAIPDQTIYVVSDQYNLCSGCPTISGTIYNQVGASYLAGDGDATYWELQTNGNFIDYILMTYVGHPNRGVGVAFDYFWYCSEAPGPGCEITPSFLSQTIGCGVQFTNTSTSGSATEIIGYHWDFGDGTTSTEENPYHYYGAPGGYHVTLTVTGFDGEECCTETFEMQVEAEECQPCEGEIGFNYYFDECDPCLMTFDAFVFNNTTPVLGYYWDFGNGIVQSGASVQQHLTGPTTVCLTVVFQGSSPDEECCTRTICWDVDCEQTGTAYEGKHGRPAPAGNSSNIEWDADTENDHLNSVQDSPDQQYSAVFPNPVDDEINIEFTAASDAKVTVELINAEGRAISLDNAHSLSAGDVNLRYDVSEVPSGIYIVKVSGGDIQITNTISIAH